jgi:DNA-directed RNA polymerase subunit F
MYSVWGELLHQFSIGREAEGGIVECKIWGSGAVCLTGDNQFIAISNLTDPSLIKSRRLAFSGLTDRPQSWVVIEPDHSASQSPEVLAATDHGSVLSISFNSTKDLGISQGPFTKMAVSPNGKLLACFTKDGILWVVSSDFSKNLSQFDTQSKVDPEQMVWCGADSVVLYWDSILLMIGPYAEYFNYSFDEPVQLIAECDGVRILSNHTCEFLQRVPDVVEDIFKIGSTASSAILYDAMDHFEKKSPKADENIRSIKNELLEAVNACTEAAGHEISHAVQRSLLKAASFGKSFLDFYDPAPFVEMCQTLRILNAVQHFEIGIPVTIQQYKMLGPWGLVEKLMNQHEHLLAIKLCEYLKIKSDRVLVHWACTKVMAKKTMLADSDICNMIVDKLSHVPGISYAEIASTAYKAGKTELATKLLDYEPRGADQVPLLLSMRQDEVALSKAIESGDTDLVYLVVLHIKRSKSPQEFFRIIKNKVVALDLLISYCKQQDIQLLNDIYTQLGQIQEAANLSVMEAYAETDTDKCVDTLQSAYNLYSEAKDVFTSKATEEQIKLLMLQKELESSLGGKYVGDSISECLFKLIKLDQSKRVAKIRSDFKVPDKRFWWLKIKALASVAGIHIHIYIHHLHFIDWMNLEKFAKEKKSPIGYG